MIKRAIINLIISAIAKTWRIKVFGDLPKAPAIIAFWHGTMLPVWYEMRKCNPYGVVSKSKDGQIFADIISFWHYKLIRGSSNDGGKEAFREMVVHAANEVICITPDGPKGTRHKFKHGAAVVAARAKCPIHCVTVDISHKKIFEKSWDKFEFPLPFTRIEMTVSVIPVPQSDSPDDIAKCIAQAEDLMK